MLRMQNLAAAILGCAMLAVSATPLRAEVQVFFPQGRTAYQTNETIDLSISRTGSGALPAAELTLTLQHDAGSQLAATWNFPATNAAQQSEHLHLNGWLLRPGTYEVQVRVGEETGMASLTLHSHVRRSEYRLVNWSHAAKPAQLLEGELSLGFNTFYGPNGKNDNGDTLLQAGVDYISNCTMSGGHQMDLRNECDWSDPLVIRGGTMRVVRRGMIDRTRGNVPGVHFYDEPGLTWDKHPVTGEFGPHGVPAQMRAYVAAFGRQPLGYHEVDPQNPDHVARWNHWARWKLSFMDAAWKDSQYGVSQVKPDYLSLTQSQYGFTAFTDGYYFNVARSLPITSGHGGYHDYGLCLFNPSYFVEMSRARDRWKPCWYLPTWYGNTTSDQFRLEQFLSFQTDLQGMISPPDLEPATNPSARQGIVETNQLFQRLGPVFQHMPAPKPPVAILFSLSQAIHAQTLDRSANYMHALPHGQTLPLVYLAGKLMQHQFLPIVEEDVLDGSLANDQKAIILASLDYLDPAVIAALEDFAKQGGAVLLTPDCTVQIAGSIKLPLKPELPDQAIVDELSKQQKYDQLGPYTKTAKQIEGALPFAQALQVELEKHHITPPLRSSVPTIIVSRQGTPDVEYLFAVNATANAEEERRLDTLPVAAELTLTDKDRPVYNAIVPGALPDWSARDQGLVANVRFGPGQMRAWAQTARPIQSVQISAPLVTRDLVLEQQPLAVKTSLAVLDVSGQILAGAIPLDIQLRDPQGQLRYQLFRATENGMLPLALPLAANDPAGTWTLQVTDQLSLTSAKTSFQYTPPARVGSWAGSTSRAVFAADDRDRVFQFARQHQRVGLVAGTSPYNQAAAKRLADVLKPWGITCETIDLAQASQSRPLSEEEAKTWIGLNYAGKGQIKAGQENPPQIAGFNVDGPVILLGTPEDNPLIKYLVEEKFLAYTPQSGMLPGTGRGMVAWQRDAVGHGVESLALIAYDEAGMQEAVGSLYEAVAGIDPLTRWNWAQRTTLVPAATPPKAIPEFPLVWSAFLPDRVEGLKTDGAFNTVLTHDGTLTQLHDQGIPLNGEVLDAAALAARRKEFAPAAPTDEQAKLAARPDRMLKLAATANGRTAAGYWGGTLTLLSADGQTLRQTQLPQDPTALAWRGNQLIVGLADGRVLALQAD